ncbi:MAG: biopolymer transporter ExbD [Lentisphaerota bacterium]
MKLRRQESPEAAVDMTPMIDCVFLLLIFFMCAATMSKVDFTPEVKLPIAPKAAVPEDLRGRGTINILPLGTSLGTGESVTEQKPFLVYGRLMDEADLLSAITEKKNADPELRIYMRVDRDADFSLVRRAIKACAGAGVFDIIFGTFQSKSGNE